MTCAVTDLGEARGKHHDDPTMASSLLNTAEMCMWCSQTLCCNLQPRNDQHAVHACAQGLARVPAGQHYAQLRRSRSGLDVQHFQITDAGRIDTGVEARALW